MMRKAMSVLQLTPEVGQGITGLGSESSRPCHLDTPCHVKMSLHRPTRMSAFIQAMVCRALKPNIDNAEITAVVLMCALTSASSPARCAIALLCHHNALFGSDTVCSCSGCSWRLIQCLLLKFSREREDLHEIQAIHGPFLDYKVCIR